MQEFKHTITNFKCCSSITLIDTGQQRSALGLSSKVPPTSFSSGASETFEFARKISDSNDDVQLILLVST